MKQQTIAKKLTGKLAAFIFVIMALLIVGSYSVVSQIVRNDIERHNGALAAVLADVIWREARNNHVPIDENMKGEIDFCCDYICRWYHIDYVYIYSISNTDGVIKLLGFSYKNSNRDILKKAQHAFGEIVALGSNVSKDTEGGLIGAIIKHIPTPEEQRIWAGRVATSQESDRFEPALESMYRLPNDGFGSNIVAVAGQFTSEINEMIIKSYLPFVSIILCIFIFMMIIIYFLIRHSVFNPVQKLVGAMNKFITDGKRSRVRADASGNDEFALMASAFNAMSDDIDKFVKENNKLASIEERRKTESYIATRIQKGFLAPPRSSSHTYEIIAKMMPAKEVGGDLYDYCDLGNGRILLTIGDVSGKGYASSIFGAVTLALIRQFAILGLTPAQILERVNNAIFYRNPSMLFVTAFVGIYDERNCTLTYSNAGHNPPYVLRDKPECLQGAQNLFLGLYEGETYTQEEIKLNVGETLFLYTDGVNEAIDTSKTFFGEERLKQTLSEFKASREEDLLEYVHNTLLCFVNGAEQNDDITMLAFTPKQHKELEISPVITEFKYIKEVILATNLPKKLQISLCVAAEEIFTNICSYAFVEQEKNEQSVRFIFEHSDHIIMRFEDNGVPYDPTKNVIDTVDYDPDEQIGGLGRLIAFTIADKVIYENVDGRNILTITKYLKEENK